jgi:hypothetical protein
MLLAGLGFPVRLPRLVLALEPMWNCPCCVGDGACADSAGDCRGYMDCVMTLLTVVALLLYSPALFVGRPAPDVALDCSSDARLRWFSRHFSCSLSRTGNIVLTILNSIASILRWITLARSRCSSDVILLIFSHNMVELGTRKATENRVLRKRRPYHNF